LNKIQRRTFGFITFPGVLPEIGFIGALRGNRTTAKAETGRVGLGFFRLFSLMGLQGSDRTTA
jgi:hypothetical protein